MEWGYINCDTLPLNELLPRFTQLLSHTQKARAAAFKTRELRDFYITRQGIVTAILAYKLNIPPQEIELAYNPYKKPYAASFPNLHFNIATTKENLIMIALSKHGPCGVDIEAIKPEPVRRLLSNELLSQNELARLKALPSTQQIIAFYNTWVQKEAYLKALGTGFYTSPESLELPVIDALPKTWPKYNPPHIFEGYELCLTLVQPDVVACLAATKGDSVSPNLLNIKTIVGETFPI